MGRNLALIVLLLVVGCAKQAPSPATSPGPVGTPPPTEDGRLAGTIVAVNVYNERREVSGAGRLLHMPETTIVGQGDDVYPQLDDSARDAIRSEVEIAFAPGPAKFEVHVYVVEGHQSFRVEEMLEIAQVRFSVRIEMVQVGDEGEVFLGEGTATSSLDAVDLARRDVDALYVGVIRSSVREGLSEIRAER